MNQAEILGFCPSGKRKTKMGHAKKETITPLCDGNLFISLGNGAWKMYAY